MAGNNRDWGYASSNEKGNLTYTSYEKNGSVNRYSDNKDGGHSHDYWSNKKDYNSGKSPDSSRRESNNSKNPSTGEVQSNGGCYLTSACIKHFGEAFDDNCNELRILRWFRDNFVSKEDIEHYYQTAPAIVEAIDSDSHNDLIYDYIYDNVIDACIETIRNGDYNSAYNRYKESILSLEETFGRKEPQPRMVKAF